MALKMLAFSFWTKQKGEARAEIQYPLRSFSLFLDFGLDQL